MLLTFLAFCVDQIAQRFDNAFQSIARPRKNFEKNPAGLLFAALYVNEHYLPIHRKGN